MHALSSSISKLPHTIIISQPLLQHVVMYRTIIAEMVLKKSPSRIGDATSAYDQNETFMSPAYDLVLKYFPMIVDDPDINYTFLSLWNERKTMEKKNRKVRLLDSFEFTHNQHIPKLSCYYSSLLTMTEQVLLSYSHAIYNVL